MRAALGLLALLALPVHAGWDWAAAREVSSARGPAIFPHLESANRQGVAAADGAVAVVWEDNRSGAPRCYAAIKPATAAVFEPEGALSAGECYEPVVASLGQGRFLAAWEEAGRVHTRVLPDGPPLRLSMEDAAQVTLATGNGNIHAAWAEKAGRHRRIVVAALALDGGRLALARVQPVESGLPADGQAWPALAISGRGGLMVAWEDRRARHTVPMASRGDAGLAFGEPLRITDQASGSMNGLGEGLGAMRPTLAAWKQGTVAVWLDKRDFLSGYDMYAAFDTGSGPFSPNLRVQDGFGDSLAQWHAGVVADDTRLTVVWDDARDGTPDVWLANWEGSGFSDNVAVPAASGPGDQSDPVAALDEHGGLHLVWLDRRADGTRVRYARAQWK